MIKLIGITTVLSLSFLSLPRFLERIIYNQCNKTSVCFLFPPLAMLDATNERYVNIDHGQTNAIAFLDLTKAFNTVAHDILLNKLELFGISGVTLKSHLIVKESTSQARYITCGVPQGSILGPLLFLIYINDLPGCFRFSTVRTYADDTRITVLRGQQIRLHNELIPDLENIKNRLLANQISLNVLKSEYMYFASDFNLANLDLCQAETVHIGNKAKSIRLGIDQRLVWEERVESLCKTISTALGAVRRACLYI